MATDAARDTTVLALQRAAPTEAAPLAEHSVFAVARPLAPPGGPAQSHRVMPPDVSVLMPFRNAEGTIGAAARSIFGQLGPALELVAVDDHSTDDSVEVLRAEAGADPRLRLVTNSGRGLVDALNTGAAACRGEWVARMDADDLSCPGRLAAQVELLRASCADVVGCRAAAPPGEDVSPGMAYYVEWVNSLLSPEEHARDLLVESPLVHPTVVMPRALLQNVGGYRAGQFPEDYDLWLRLAKSGARFCKHPQVLLYWRDSAERLTRTDPRYSPFAFRTLKARSLADGLVGSIDRVQIWGAGPDGKAWLPELERVGIAVMRYFDIDPRKIGGRIRGRVPVLAWEKIEAFRDTLTLVSVGAKGARALIRHELQTRSFVEGRDFVCVQ
jgi:glycosyltransferase involved in cell wall biosynthesis